MKIQLSIVLALGIVLYGCANPSTFNAVKTLNEQAEQEGSPFRWQVESVSGGTILYQEMIPLPSGPSKADGMLKADTLEIIRKAEETKGRSEVQLEDVKHLPDGREVWVFKNSDWGIAYIVKYYPSSKGGTDIEIQGPVQYKKWKQAYENKWGVGKISGTAVGKRLFYVKIHSPGFWNEGRADNLPDSIL